MGFALENNVGIDWGKNSILRFIYILDFGIFGFGSLL
jgi:hypothetical protein